MIKLTRAASWLLGPVLAMPLVMSDAPPAGAQEDTLRVVMHSDLKIVDPIWTTAYISRNYGYMVYDTLFALDEHLEVQPQMVDSYEISDDNLTYTFTLRDGLLWHDGEPVTSEDAIASIQRWGQNDSMGQLLMRFVDSMKAVDDKTFEMQLKEPYGLVLLSLAKPSSNVPFMMPKRIAETPASEQISEYVGSGPFVFESDEWEPGNKAVFTKFEDYKPRDEPPSWAAGGKVAKVDRVEWLWIPDHQTAVNALINGEIDVIEAPPHDLLPVIEADESIVAVRLQPARQPVHVPHELAASAVRQSEGPPGGARGAQPGGFPECRDRRSPLLQGLPGDVRLRHAVRDRYGRRRAAGLGLRAVQAAARGGRLRRHPGHADALDRPAGADQPGAGRQAAPGEWRLHGRHAVDGLADAGRAPGQEEPPAEGGWNALLTSWVAADVLNPISTAGLNASCDDGWFGWPCDQQLEKMRLAFATETDPAKQTSWRTRSRRARSRSARTPMSASGTSRSRIATTCRGCWTAPRRSSGTSARASDF